MAKKNDFLLSDKDLCDKDLCGKDLSGSELYMALLGMEDNKSPGNDGLTKEFYVFSGMKSKIYSIILPVYTALEKRN